MQQSLSYNRSPFIITITLLIAMLFLWKLAVASANNENATERNRGSMMATLLNDITGAVTTRKSSRETTVPESILNLLFLLCLHPLLLWFTGAKKTDAIVASVFYNNGFRYRIFYPLELITIDAAEKNIIKLKEMLKQT